VISGGEMSDRSRFATPADFPRHGRSPCRWLHVHRESLRFVHRSRGIFCRLVPNPSVTIRNFCIASIAPCSCSLASFISCVPPCAFGEAAAGAMAQRAHGGRRESSWWRGEQSSWRPCDLTDLWGCGATFQASGT
jgi:hypothetical protein